MNDVTFCWLISNSNALYVYFSKLLAEVCNDWPLCEVLSYGHVKISHLLFPLGYALCSFPHNI